MSFTLTSILTTVEIGEAAEDGSFRRTQGESPSVSVKFIIRGADDASTAYTSLISWLYVNYADGSGGIAAYNMPMKQVDIESTTHPNVYTATCTFNNNDGETESINNQSYQAPDIEDNDFSYSTTGGTSHITHSIATLGAVASSGYPLNFGGGIGWNGEGFDGCDIITPNVAFSISVSRPKSFLNAAKRIALTNMTGFVNSVSWGGFDARCVVFCGLQANPKALKYTDSNGDEVKDWYWRLSYSFQAAPATTLTFGNTTLNKAGFDYIWRMQSKTENSNTGEIQSEITQVNVERVYPMCDFSALGLTFPSASNDPTDPVNQ